MLRFLSYYKFTSQRFLLQQLRRTDHVTHMCNHKRELVASLRDGSFACYQNIHMMVCIGCCSLAIRALTSLPRDLNSIPDHGTVKLLKYGIGSDGTFTKRPVSEVNVMGLSDMTFKTEVTRHGRRSHDEDHPERLAQIQSRGNQPKIIE